MVSVKGLKEGVMFDLDKVSLTSINPYHSEYNGTISVRWRHVFFSESGEKIVYTGSKRIAQHDRWYHLRAKIKRQEPQYNSTRICRPVLTPCDERQKVLDV